MAGTWKFYSKALEKIAEGSIDLDTDTFHILLTTSSYTPDQNAHDFRDDITNEVTTSGTYTISTGAGNALSGFSGAMSTNAYQVSWTSPAFTSATITARTAVIYKRRGGAASADELLAYCTESGDVTSTAGTFTITLPTPTLTITAS
jgi:hypothetical protein